MLRDQSPISTGVEYSSFEAVLEEAHPLRLAEEVGFVALDNFQGLRPDARGIVQGWNSLEKALATDSSQTRHALFAEAKTQFRTVASDPTNIDEHIRASMALAALRSFRSRAQGRQPGSRIMTSTYQEMSLVLSQVGGRAEMGGGWIGDEEDGSIRQAHGGLTEGLAYTMLLRSNKSTLFPYPASPREDAAAHRRKAYNHDLYVIDKSIGKIPIQTKRNEEEGDFKTELRIRDGVASIVLNPLITAEVRELRREMIADGDDISWYTLYRDIGRPDTFLAQCLEPNLHSFPNAHHAYAASTLVKRVSTAVIHTLKTQIFTLQNRTQGTSS